MGDLTGVPVRRLMDVTAGSRRLAVHPSAVVQGWLIEDVTSDGPWYLELAMGHCPCCGEAINPQVSAPYIAARLRVTGVRLRGGGLVLPGNLANWEFASPDDISMEFALEKEDVAPLLEVVGAGIKGGWLPLPNGGLSSRAAAHDGARAWGDLIVTVLKDPGHAVEVRRAFAGRRGAN